MKTYAVVGASSGTGRYLTQLLADRGDRVRAISRHPPEQRPGVEPYAADVTDRDATNVALASPFDAVFFTVDIHGLTQSRESIRAVMYEGCVNAMNAALAGGAKRFVLLSVIGADQPSWVWWILNALKRGMQRNIVDREQALKASGLPYVIIRAPKLGDGPAGTMRLAATPSRHRLDMKLGIFRSELAMALLAAADGAPKNFQWDVFTAETGPVPAWLGSISKALGENDARIESEHA